MLVAVPQMTDFSPKAGWISTGLPHVVEQMLAYLFNVSAALALINMAPVFYFDGQAALEALLGLQGTEAHNQPLQRSSSLKCALQILLVRCKQLKRSLWSLCWEDVCCRLAVQLSYLVLVLPSMSVFLFF